LKDLRKEMRIDEKKTIFVILSPAILIPCSVNLEGPKSIVDVTSKITS
jgi:hypothetical protein